MAEIRFTIRKINCLFVCVCMCEQNNEVILWIMVNGHDLSFYVKIIVAKYKLHFKANDLNLLFHFLNV